MATFVRSLLFITHSDVTIDPTIPVTQWSLSPVGRQRMERFATSLPKGRLRSVWSSRERKAVEAAEILGRTIDCIVSQDERLGENDRSSTGYLPPARFEATADRFFSQPYDSIEGWERAIDAQARIAAAIDDIIVRSDGSGDVAVVSHGAVGTLLLCRLKGVAISRREDQPGQGHWFAFECAGKRLLHGWRRVG